MAANESSEALQVDSLNRKEMDGENLHSPAGNRNRQVDEDEGKEEKRTGDEMHSCESKTVQPEMSERPQGGAQLTEAKLKTLGVKSSVDDQSSGLPLSTSTIESTGEAHIKGQIAASRIEPTGTVAVKVANVQTQSQAHLSVSQSTSEMSPTSVTLSVSSAPSPIIADHSLSAPKGSRLHMPKSDQKNHSNGKKISPILIGKSTSDGYNWRKYGQKQVKSPTGSRSYYRCTHSDCSAKKIECSDHLGHVVEIVYRSHHSHDPPRKVTSSKESKITPYSMPLVENSVLNPVRMHDDIDPPTCSKEAVRLTPSTSETKQQDSFCPMDNDETKVKEEHVNKLELKKRVRKEDLAYSDTHLKPGKKPKYVVHAMGNVAISGDGYRWRKYGQKMVKGNSNPRNYYRCTSAGCPVRKHIETAVDNTSSVIITYKGMHDHDMPVPKKRHGPPNTPLVAAAAAPPAVSTSSLPVKKVETLQNQISSSQKPVEKEGELTSQAMDLGGEKAMESARTLLSIGFEIKPC